jgi:hypothetical protein
MILSTATQGLQVFKKAILIKKAFCFVGFLAVQEVKPI